MGRAVLMLAANIPCLAFLGTGVYLLLHDHPTAGGWLVFAAVISAVELSFRERNSEEKRSA